MNLVRIFHISYMADKVLQHFRSSERIMPSKCYICELSSIISMLNEGLVKIDDEREYHIFDTTTSLWKQYGKNSMDIKKILFTDSLIPALMSASEYTGAEENVKKLLKSIMV